ncbi:hypothetical protein [Streptomyces sp. NRRL S-1521]|uniref:hypothetical protein n=2 Tax=unclassified Streptomyces TaxID=2593676 RepID=UPI000A822E23|nr:hypothetical protein [Streptomyces sp. NRRL S-1521]
MMTRATGRETVEKCAVAAICVAALLLTATACGDDKGTDPSGGEPLTQKELSRSALDQGDVSGYEVTEVETVKGRTPKAGNESCQPIVDAMFSDASAFDERAAARSIVEQTKGSRNPAAAYRLVLSGVESESAGEQEVTGLKKAIADCGSGFSTDASGISKKIRSVRPNKSSVGEEGVDFSLEYQSGRKVRYVVKRVDASLLTIAAETQFAHSFTPVPQKIVEAQTSKLEKAVR